MDYFFRCQKSIFNLESSQREESKLSKLEYYSLCRKVNFNYIRGGFRARRGERAPSLFFAITCFFCNHFEELQTVLLDVELIIDNAL